MPIVTTRDPQYAEHVQGGEGRILRDPLLTDNRLGGTLSYVSQITLEPGCSIGIHRHVGDNELYFLTAGEATYTENGVESHVKKGDALFCEEGSTHGILNCGNEPLTFIAVIQKTA